MVGVRRRNVKQPKFNEKDYVSCLPDDILLIIVSKLAITDGARTTILSTRWRNLWTLPTSILRIDASNSSKFQKAVDHILHHHACQTIDELRIENHCKSTNNWVKILTQKQVKILELDFQFTRFDSYPALGSITLFSLVTLRLKSATLTCRLMDCILANSPNLQELSIKRSVWDSWSRARMRICGPSLKLKHLELIDNLIPSLEISAPNLVSFNYYHTVTPRMYLMETPRLTRLSSYSAGYGFCKVLPQLESLTLVISDYSAEIPHFPTLKNLKQMRVSLGEDFERGLLLFLRLFEASIYLCRLWLNLGANACPLMMKHKLVDDDCCPEHQWLQEVEIHGYCGVDNEVQLVVRIAQSSSLSLQKLIIHPNYLKYLKSDQSAHNFTQQRQAKNVVERLQSRLPQNKVEIYVS